MQAKRLAAGLTALAVLLVILGVVLGRHQLRRYEAETLQNADERLLHLADETDQAIAASLEGYLEDLAQASGSPQVQEALEEDTPDQVAIALWDALPRQEAMLSAALVVRGDAPYLSARQPRELHFAPQSVLAADTEMLPCLDGEGGIYLAVLRRETTGMYCGVLVDFPAFYREIAGNIPGLSDDSQQKQVFMLDIAGTTLIALTDQALTAELLSDASGESYRAGSLLLQQQEAQAEGAAFLSPDPLSAAAVRLAAVPARVNGYFAIGIAADYSTFLAPLRTLTTGLILCGVLIVAGLLVLVALLARMSGRTLGYRQELAAVQAKADAVEALNCKTQQLAHHQRLEMMGTLTSSISHEFNNLLAPIMGYSLMALEKLPESDTELYDDILEIYNTSVKAKTLVQRLSDLSRKHPETAFRQLSPDDLVRKVMSVAQPAKPENVEVRLNLGCGETCVEGNELQLSQILLNLILNAFDAMGEQGGILTLSTGTEGTSVLFRVADTGPGIRPEVIPHIFEPFFTTKSQGHGTGLGLAIVSQMVEDHHGDIDVESRLGVGTTFFVTIPIRQP